MVIVSQGSVSDPDQGELCLWRAYATCKSATLMFSSNGVDTSEQHAIIVQRENGSCTITDAVRYRGMLASRSVTTFTCASLQQQDDGLLVKSCGAYGDVQIPPRPAQQQGRVCGEVYAFIAPPNQLDHVGSSDGVTVREVEQCFWSAYTSCAATTTLVVRLELDYPATPTPNSVFGVHTLVVQRAKGACALTDSYTNNVNDRWPQPPIPPTVTCAGLMRQADGGLVAQACGKFGDITIPPDMPPSS